MRAIGDRCADLRASRGVGVVIPVIPLAALDIALEVVEIVDRPVRGVGVILPLPPVRERHVIVDPDKVDLSIRPERVEVKVAIPAPLRLIAEIFRPIRRIADLRLCPEDRADLPRQRAQRRHGGKARVVTDLRQRAHFGADAKGLHPASGRTQGRLMQNEPSVGPLRRAGIGDMPRRDAEITGRGGAKERRDLCPRCRCAVGGTCNPRRARGGDTTAPRQCGLAHTAGPRIGQRVLFGLIHQDKGVEHHLLTARRHLANRLDHRGIGGGATVDRAALVVPGDQTGSRARHPGDVPRHAGVGRGGFGQRTDRAITAAQVVPEPTDDEGDVIAARQLRLHLVERGREVGLARG